MRFLLFLLFALHLSGQEKVVIIGGGPAGLSAGIYAGRLALYPVILEGSCPASISYKVENYPGFPEGIDRIELLDRLRRQALQSGAKILPQTAIKVDMKSSPFQVTLENGETLLAETLILASGTRGYPGLESDVERREKGIASCPLCEGPLFAGKRVVVVGKGEKAEEKAALLANLNCDVSLICQSEIAEICKLSCDGIAGLDLKDGSHVTCEAIFLADSHLPNTELFVGQIALDERGYIMTHNTATSLPGVFAAGDVANPHVSQIILSTASGCQAAIDAYDYLNFIAIW